MKINDYIIRGGENLNDAPRKTSSFPADAERVFDEWHSKLGKDDREKENYFEVPVNDRNRLFIRSFYVEEAGNRPICFYVGLLVPKEAYIEANYYYCIHKGLCGVSFSEIQKAAKASFLPIEIRTDWPIPKTPIGLEFQDLSKMKLYDDKKFNFNINQMCLSISIHTIDDWFSRLFIAVNPYRLSRSFHIVVSRKKPQEPMPDDDRPKYPKASPANPKPKDNTTLTCVPGSSSSELKKSSMFQWKRLAFFILALVIVCLFHHLLCCGYRNRLCNVLNNANKKLGETIKGLQTACSNLNEDNNKKGQKIKHLEYELAQRDAEIEKLKRQLSHQEGSPSFYPIPSGI